MSEFHVGCGMFGIYAGVLEKNQKQWKSKSCVTDEAIEAVRDYMLQEFCGNDDVKTGGWEWTRKDGKIVELRVAVKDV